jgi:hypothetical protein
MNLQDLDFVPLESLEESIEELKVALKPVFDDECNEIHDFPLDLYRSEALESLGILQLYSGNYGEAVVHLQKSIGYDNTLDRRGSRRVTYTRLLVSSLSAIV